jgi:PKD repeat protein
VRITSTGAAVVGVTKLVNSTTTETVIGSEKTASGLSVAPNQPLRIRVQAIGANPTTLRVKTWLASASEPSAWNVTVTDADAALQGSGTVGVAGLLPATSTNAPVVVTVDNVLVQSPPSPPVAVITAGCSGSSCTFDSSSSTDADGSIVTRAWDFGDGTTGSGPQVVHNYAAPGTYAVKLTVTDNDGLVGASSTTVTV